MAAAQSELPLIVVVGATATGKSALGVELAHRLGGEVVNADSMQLYRGMDIGTAKVTDEERRGVPHHLLDVLDVTQEASVAVYRLRAREIIAEIRGRGRVPVLVGGSGLYVRAVIDSIEFPPTDPQLRSVLTQRLEDTGPDPLREELREIDPESAAAVQDDRRLIRALEVVRLTGRSFSSFMPQRLHEPQLEPVRQIGLRMPRALLRERIETRVQRMAAGGLLEEVRTLALAGLRQGRTASRAIGYQQFLAVLDGQLTQREAIEETVASTRRFAKRQDTWFRADPRISWLDVDMDAEDVVGELAERAQAALQEVDRSFRR
ncbi:tRNA (adenosine(37)-N6)-dimethylallyltransferase MiaA [Nesterenkonia sp. HG001]|uniref:tRNA (adenosine(37)-N6)-dimethylallyltransferase MiaA n=1 Tax=Nesterenkonia sp. HG001 TaxID=2983207 RepID=UPI002AC65F22|nr:tRNA (adenosine(37)-N6)-dimethylallyltransferase MiaA [Nesterenkonia sp. HG001]MDZ5076058.1 tRNA (adenosine(37)-N6)-dimethylallyltransferase MiaA [Nesterenkonia sp. HG001]